ncbi:MAG: ABC transporter permease [Nitrospirae bacterium]|nr:ABC transporter permease [Nitrospirota bacterium]
MTDDRKNQLGNLPTGQSLWRDACGRLRKDKISFFALLIILLYSGVAILSQFNLIAPDYQKTDFVQRYLPPSGQHLLGTDHMGRDVFQRVIHGSNISMKVGLVTSLIAIPLGILFGSLAGYYGGRIDELIVWFYSTVASIPELLLIITIAYVLKGRISAISAIYVAIGLSSWVGICRVMRGEFLKHKEREYIQAEKALGAGSFRIMFRHILPNVFHLVIINFSLRFPAAIKTEVILSYLGLGVEKQPSWGLMIADAQQELSRGVWWQFVGAILAMFFIILAFNIFGDALRDALDPKLRGEKI